MKKIKRILAFTAAVLLVAMYLATLITALIDSPVSSRLFKASIAATILIPVLLYAYILIARLAAGRKDDTENNAPSDIE